MIFLYYRIAICSRTLQSLTLVLTLAIEVIIYLIAVSIVELHEVKRHLHYADDSNDASLKSFIVAADAIIKNYITDNFGSEYPSAIKQAALLLIEYWEQHRKDGGEVSVNGNYLPIPVLSLLNLYRKPTV